MLGKTHVSVGVASALIFTHPDTIPGVLCAVTGGAVGGWLCDIDCRNSEIKEGELAGGLIAALTATFGLFLDYVVGGGVCDYMRSHWGAYSAAGLMVLLGLCAWGAATSHRTFMHSIVGIIALSISMLVFCMPMAAPFTIGLVSHVILDLTNKRGLQLFYPFKKKVCLRLCKSDGTANSVVMGISSVLAIVAGSVLLLRALIVQNTLSGAFYWLCSKDVLFGLSAIEVYLVVINVVTFIVFCFDHWICTHTKLEDGEEYGQEFIHTILNFLPMMGGAFGMLLSFVVLRQKLGKHNANWHAVAISLTIIWGVIYCTLCNPLNIEILQGKYFEYWHLVLGAYAVGINLLSALLFKKFRFDLRSKWGNSNVWLFIICLMGGTLGGLLVMLILGNKEKSPALSYGFSFLLAAQSFLFGYLWILE